METRGDGDSNSGDGNSGEKSNYYRPPLTIIRVGDFARYIPPRRGGDIRLIESNRIGVRVLERYNAICIGRQTILPISSINAAEQYAHIPRLVLRVTAINVNCGRTFTSCVCVCGCVVEKR